MANYSDLKLIAQNSKSRVYSAFCHTLGKSVIIKTTASSFPRPAEISRIEHEFEVLQAIHAYRKHHPNDKLSHSFAGHFTEHLIIGVHRIETVRNIPWIVLEDIGGKDLSKLPMMNVIDLLNLVIRLAKGFKIIHDSGLLHKDINPSNIILNNETNELRIIDFANSEYIDECQTNDKVHDIEKSLAYLAPEQTGRVRGAIDQRTDLYSLGTVIFELFSGRPPFLSDDQIGYIHSHIAKPAPLLRDYRSDIPIMLSDIVLKLMQKNKKDRYQTIDGLLHDLELCLEIAREGKINESRPLGLTDHKPRIVYSSTPYGRFDDMTTLLQAASDEAAAELSPILIAGDMGIGKSTFLKNFTHQLNRDEVFVFYAACDWEQKKAFSSFAKLVDSMMIELLKLNDEDLSSWKSHIISTMDDDLNLLCHLFPSLNALAEEQTLDTHIVYQELENKVFLTLIAFIECIVEYGNRVIFILDDMQWCDDETWQLLKRYTYRKKKNSGKFIFSYRPQDLRLHIDLSCWIDCLKTEFNATVIYLSRWSYGDMHSFLNDSIDLSDSDGRLLADSIYSKTKGNPEYIKLLVSHFIDKNILTFDVRSHLWLFDAKKCLNLALPDQISDYLVGRQNELSIGVTILLQQASCFGLKFNLLVMSDFLKKTIPELENQINQAELMGVVRRVGSHKEAAFDSLDDCFRSFWYQFQNDRIRESHYASMDAQDRKKIHLKIARFFKSSCSYCNLEIEMMSHFIKAGVDFLDDSEKMGVALQAYQIASEISNNQSLKASTPFYRFSREILSQFEWNDNYDVLVESSRKIIESEFNHGDAVAADKEADCLLARSLTPRDRAEIHYLRANWHGSRGNHDEATNDYIEGLKALGIQFPRRFFFINLILDSAVFLLLFLRGYLKYMSSLPVSSNKNQALVEKILNSLVQSAFMSNQFFLASYANIKAFRVLMKGGISSESAQTLIYSVVPYFIMRRVNFAKHVANLALSWSSKYSSDVEKVCVEGVYGFFVQHWHEDYDKLRLSIERLQKKAEAVGDGLWIANAACSWVSYSCDLNLDQRSSKLSEKLAVIASIGNEDYFQMMTKLQRLIYHLKLPLADESIKLDEFKISFAQNNPTLSGIYHLEIVKASFLLGEESHLRFHLQHVIRNKSYLDPLIVIVEADFFEALYEISSFDRTSWTSHLRSKMKLYRIFSRIKNHAKYNPQNFDFYHLVLKAELAALFHWKIVDIGETYEKAISIAQNKAFFWMALVQERVGIYYYKRGIFSIAKSYLLNAAKSYEAWGSEAISQRVMRDFANLKSFSADFDLLISGQDIDREKSLSSFFDAAQLDMQSIFKASSSLAENIELSKVIKDLISITAEYAGADYCVLLLIDEKGLMINGIWSGADVSVLLNEEIHFSVYKEICPDIVRICLRTRKTLVVDDATTDERFCQNSYVLAKQLHSVLCVPIINQKNLLGILYLENSKMIRAFSTEQLKVLSHLANQGAISIKHSNYLKQVRKKILFEGQLELARTVQDTLLPSNVCTPGFEVVSHYQSADHAGGDWFDYHYFKTQNILMICVGDITGHGVSSAIMTGVVSGAVKTVVEVMQNEDETFEVESFLLNVARIVNKVLYQTGNQVGRCMTMMLVGIDVETGRGFFLNAGHTPLLLRASNGNVQSLVSQGNILGMQEDLVASCKPFLLEEEGLLFLYTDGLLDNTRENKKLMKYSKLKKIIGSEGDPASIKKVLIMSTQSNSIENQIKDDATFIIIKRNRLNREELKKIS